MLFPNLKERLEIEGIMPERALLRLKRAGIGVYNAKKVEKNRILLSVKKKDTEKVFAIYPNVCYNSNASSPYTVRKIGGVGIGKAVETLSQRVGAVLGALLFCAGTLYADRFVFAVDFVGSAVYARETYAALEQGGIKPFAPYRKERVDWVCSQLLALEGVEFCSVQKKGLRVQVEMRLSEFAKTQTEKGAMQAKHEGEILSLTVLRGTALKSAGETVRIGETLVGDWFSVEEGEQVRVEIIARARIACVYETELRAESAEEAFAAAYLGLSPLGVDGITDKEITESAGLFHVKIFYTATETMNF